MVDPHVLHRGCGRAPYTRAVFGPDAFTLDWIAGVGVVLAGALVWLVYFRWKDRHPEPLRLVAMAYLSGAVAVGLALLGYLAAERLGLPTEKGESVGSVARFCLLTVGPVEEGAKFLTAWLLFFRHRECDEEIDGLVYATAVALGFASFENVLYLPHVEWPARLARAISTPLAHSVFAAIWGLGWARGKFESKSRLARIAWPGLTLLAAAIVHAAYDLAILAHGATLVAGVLVFSIWGWLVLRAKVLVADDGPVHRARHDLPSVGPRDLDP